VRTLPRPELMGIPAIAKVLFSCIKHSAEFYFEKSFLVRKTIIIKKKKQRILKNDDASPFSKDRFCLISCPGEYSENFLPLLEEQKKQRP